MSRDRLKLLRLVIAFFLCGLSTGIFASGNAHIPVDPSRIVDPKELRPVVDLPKVPMRRNGNQPAPVTPYIAKDTSEGSLLKPTLSVPHDWVSKQLRIDKVGNITFRGWDSKNLQVSQDGDGNLFVEGQGVAKRKLSLPGDITFIYELAWAYLNRGLRWNPSVVKFLNRYLGFRVRPGDPITTNIPGQTPPHVSPGPGKGQQTMPDPSADPTKVAPRQLVPKQLDPKLLEPKKIAPAGPSHIGPGRTTDQGKTDQGKRPQSTSLSDRGKSDPMTFELDFLRRLPGGGEVRGLCVGTPVAKTLANAAGILCRVALLTAGHCFNENQGWYGIRIRGVKTFLRNSIKYVTRGRSNNVKPDAAIFEVTTECSKFPDKSISRVAPASATGLLQLDDRERIYTKKRTTPVVIKNAVTNPGEGKIVHGFKSNVPLETNDWSFKHAPNSADSGKGDSGSPLWVVRNGIRYVIAPMSGGVGHLRITAFDQYAAGWIKKTLDQWFPNQSRPRIPELPQLARKTPGHDALDELLKRKRIHTPSVNTAALNSGLQKCVDCHKARGMTGPSYPNSLAEAKALLEKKGVDLLSKMERIAMQDPLHKFNANESQAIRSFLKKDQGAPRSIAPTQLTALRQEMDSLKQRIPSFQQAIDRYKKLSYFDGSVRERHQVIDVPLFENIPEGKLVFAYVGTRDNKRLEDMVRNNPKVRDIMIVKRYHPNTPEAKRMNLFGAVGYPIDGMGRKITRYTGQTPEYWLQHFINGREPQRLRDYLAAKSGVNRYQMLARHLSNPNPGATDPRKTLLAKVDPPKRSLTKLPKGHVHFTADTPQKFDHMVNSKCVSCHDGNPNTGKKEAAQFPSFVTNWKRWSSILKNSLSPLFPKARSWLQKFVGKVAHGTMLHNIDVSKLSHLGKEMSSFLKAKGDEYLTKTQNGDEQLGSDYMIAKVDRSKLPEYFDVMRNMNVQDPSIRDLLDNFDIIYDKTGVPSWSWAPEDGDSGRRGQRPVETTEPAGPPKPHLFQYDPSKRKYNWKQPFSGGFAFNKNTRGLKKFFLVKFPRDKNGKIIRGVVDTEYQVNYKQLNGGVNKWIGPGGIPHDDLKSPVGVFPKGTVVAEVLYSTSLGEPIAIDVLTRTKTVSEDGRYATWAPDAHRQDSSPEAIREWVRNQPDFGSNPDYQKILHALDHPVRDAIVSNLGVGGPPPTFVVNGRRSSRIPGSKSVLPPGIDKEILRRMYKEIPLTSAAGSPGWQLEAQDVFRNSHRGIPIDSMTCANCHNHAGESFRTVFADSGLPTSSVSAYGNLQGYDGVLSAMWHSKRDLAQYGRKITYRMDSEWGRFFEQYNRNRHGRDTYVMTKDRTSGNNHPLRNGADTRFLPPRI